MGQLDHLKGQNKHVLPSPPARRLDGKGHLH